MTRFLNPRALYLAGLGLAALVTVDLMRRFRRSDTVEDQPAPAAPTVTAPPTVPAARPQPAAPKAAAPTPKPAPKPKASGGDDLTQIKGIGPTYAKRLKDAGLTTYTDIANASADELRAITRATAADPSQWINEARSLNGH